jgi:hypothetical protein
VAHNGKDKMKQVNLEPTLKTQSNDEYKFIVLVTPKPHSLREESK